MIGVIILVMFFVSLLMNTISLYRIVEVTLYIQNLNIRINEVELKKEIRKV